MQTPAADKVLFHFERKVSDRGRRGLIGTLVIAAVFGAIDIYLLHQPVQIGHVVGTWFAGLLILLVSLMTVWCLNLLRSGERWAVIIDSHDICWESPRGSGELSFQMPLSEIDRILLQPASSPLLADEYRLICKTREPLTLHPGTSNIPVEAVIKTLTDSGIRLEKS